MLNIKVMRINAKREVNKKFVRRQKRSENIQERKASESIDG